jgi:hypothetical protein
MAWTRTDIGNLILRKCGIKDEMSNVDTDTGPRAKAVRAVLDLAIESLMSEAPWPLSHQYVELSLVDGDADEPYNDDWTYAYRRNVAWMKFLRVIEEDGGDRQPTESSEIPWGITSDGSGGLILTDQEDAEGEVIVLPEEGYFPAKFVEALVIKGAMLAGPSLFGDIKKGMDLQKDYENAVSSAKVTAANEMGHNYPQLPPGMRARNGSGTYNGRGTAWTAHPNGYNI